VAQNYRCRLGEIDLVMLHRDCLVFVEVRFRAANRFASARLSVDSRKQLKLIRTAAIFLSQNPQYARHAVRFDVVAIDDGSVEWICDAFRPADNSY
jgi:putative endonuclease